MTINQYHQSFDQYRMDIFYFAYSRLGNREDAEDITITAFLRLWKVHESVEVDKVKAFMMVMVNRMVIDYARRYSRLRETPFDFSRMEEDIPDTQHTDITAGVLKFILSVIDGLPPKEQRIIKMRYLEGIRPGDIAKELGVSISTVNNTVGNGLKHIREKIKKPIFEY